MLTLNNVSFTYPGGVEAVKNAEAKISEGIYLLIGSNGSGKTTLLRLMSSLLFATEGSVNVDGQNIAKRPIDIMQQVFFLPDDLKLHLSSIAEMEKRHACFYPHYNPELLRANLGDFGLTGQEKFADLSLGMKRKSLLAYALSLGVKYLLLDEPANGMDIDSKKILSQIINRSVPEDGSVVIATHNVHELSNMFTDLLYIDHGSLRLAMSLAQLTERVAFVTSPSPVPGAAYQEPQGGVFHAVIANEDEIESSVDFPLLFSALTSANGESLANFINTYNPRTHEL